MSLGIIFGRTILMYFIVFLVLRIMGKREIGKLSMFDLVISIMIAEIGVFVLEDLQKPIIEGLIPMFTLVIIQIVMAFITMKNRKLRLWFDGKPSYLIEAGKINRDEMKKQKYTIDDLLLQLRENQVRSVADVEFAVLETTGKLSVIKKDEDQAGIPLLLIMDGDVIEEHLNIINRDRTWLKEQIQKHGANDFDEVFFCTIDYEGRMLLNKK